jgi:hypothetical protein
MMPERTVSKGERTGGEKLKPKRASRIRSVDLRAEVKASGLSRKGMWRWWSCFWRPVKIGAEVGLG